MRMTPRYVPVKTLKTGSKRLSFVMYLPWLSLMRRVLLLHQTEGGAVMRNDLSALDVEIEIAPLADADVAMSRPDFDAVIVEAAANVEETRRVLESPARQARAAMLLMARAEQVPSVEPAWPVDDFVVLPAAASELALRIRRAVFQKTALDSDNLLSCGDLVVDMANYKVFVDDSRSASPSRSSSSFASS